MADVSSHIPGTFSWAELATTDWKTGVSFYRTLFGWDVGDIPLGPVESYSMFLKRGREVAAACTMQPAEREHGVPPHWNMYVTVTDVDDIVKRAERLHGTIVAPPFDVMDAGRMAVLQDPSGAVFCVWQAKTHIGAKVLNEPGSLCWTELTTRDTNVAEAFYTQLFGWTAKHSAPAAVMEYTEFSVQGQPSIGMLTMPAGMPLQVPSFWMPYFQVADCDATTAKAAELGGSVMKPPDDIPNTGRFSILRDPQGAVFAVFKLAGS